MDRIHGWMDGLHVELDENTLKKSERKNINTLIM